MNCQCFLALLFFIKLVAAVSGTIVQADDHFANQVYLAAECYNVGNAVTTILNYNPSGNIYVPCHGGYRLETPVVESTNMTQILL
jgi:hypothetical protein